MKGLLAKDTAILFQRSRILLLMVIWGGAMNFMMEDSSFVVGWIVMIATITSISTIAYDEYDNCMPFIMSMPVTRKIYTLEKYLFSGLAGLIFWAIAVIIAIITTPMTGRTFNLIEELPGMFAFLPLMMLILAISLPPQLKWGAEKGRIVMIIIFAAVFGIGFILSNFKGLALTIQTTANTIPTAISLLVLFAAGIILLAASILLSIRIMEKKEF